MKKMQNEIRPHDLTQGEIIKYRARYEHDFSELSKDMAKIQQNSRYFHLKQILDFNDQRKFNSDLYNRIIGNEENLSVLKVYFSSDIFALVKSHVPRGSAKTLNQAVEIPEIARKNPEEHNSALQMTQVTPATVEKIMVKVLVENNNRLHLNRGSNDAASFQDPLIAYDNQRSIFTAEAMEWKARGSHAQPAWNTAAPNNTVPQNLFDSGSKPVDPAFPQMFISSTELGFFPSEGLINSGNKLLADHDARQAEECTDSAERFINDCI